MRKSEVNTPKPKKSIVVELCPNKKALNIHFSTEDARDFIIEVKKSFAEDWLLGVTDKIPGSHVLIVSPCFDFNEVRNYIIEGGEIIDGTSITA